ncbi:hypothetical protein [Actinoplanes sp. G11-F43]|uniref:hypothetical protein n=1 Tax=Actinoplanes sp. G11-F43 TaxID=3424130 RepID=UPI003D359326
MTAVEHARTTAVVPAPAPFEPSDAESAMFRFPAPDDPPPGNARLLIVALYGAALGICGVAVGLYAVVAVFGGAPGWYLPALAGLTLVSVGPVVAALLAIHRRALPWLLLAAAAPPMAANVYLALSY